MGSHRYLCAHDVAAPIAEGEVHRARVTTFPPRFARAVSIVWTANQVKLGANAIATAEAEWTPIVILAKLVIAHVDIVANIQQATGVGAGSRGSRAGAKAQRRSAGTIHADVCGVNLADRRSSRASAALTRSAKDRTPIFFIM